MKYVDHWIDYHHFHNEDVVEFKKVVKTWWEVLMMAILAVMVAYTTVVVISPDLAYSITRFFL